MVFNMATVGGGGWWLVVVNVGWDMSPNNMGPAYGFKCAALCRNWFAFKFCLWEQHISELMLPVWCILANYFTILVCCKC